RGCRHLLRFPRQRRCPRRYRRHALHRWRAPHPRVRHKMNSTFSSEDLEVLRNRTFDEIVVGDRATIQRTLTAADIQLFAAMSGEPAPRDIDAESAARLHGVIGHGMW